MASQFLKFLENIDNGRKQCIKNANKANLQLSQDASLDEIAGKFLDPDLLRPAPETEWQVPSEWPDLRTILNSAPVYENRKACVVLLLDTASDSFTTGSFDSSGHIYDMYCSDGTKYSSYISSWSHTWDTSKDLDYNGFKYRYIIGYTLSSLSSGSSYSLLDKITPEDTIAIYVGNQDFNQRELSINGEKIQYVLVDYDATNLDVGGFTYSYCPSLRRVDWLGATTWNINSMLRDSKNISCMNLPGVHYLNNSGGGNQTYSIFYGVEPANTVNLCNVKTLTCTVQFAQSAEYWPNHLDLSNVEEIKCGSSKNNSAFRYCKEGFLNLPKLKKLNGAYSFYQSNIRYADFSNLVEITGEGAFTQSNFYILNLPALTTVNLNYFADCAYGLEELHIPKVSGSTGSDGVNMLYNAWSLKKLTVGDNFYIPTIDLSKSNLLPISEVVKLFNQLKDISNESALSGTVLLPSTTLTKITEEELAIATNKGWTIQ